MCEAFSGLLHQERGVLWKMGIDSHSGLADEFGLKDDTDRKDGMVFARFEITPNNGDYLFPDKWTFKLDEKLAPVWWNPGCEMLCWESHKEWVEELDKIIVRKKSVHPFKDVMPPQKITKKHIAKLKTWNSVRASVWDSVRASVGNSVGNSVRDSVGNSVWNSVWDSVRDSVRDSVGNSVWNSVWASVGNSVGDSVGNSVWASVRDSVGNSVGAYLSSFFSLPRSSWKYTDKIKRDTNNPFQPAIDLWEMGIVPSFDGEKWRLHGGKDGKVLWEGVIE